jgi:putative Holliday junction resolvase
MGRILSLDYGRRRIGVAVSDPLRITAQGLETIVVGSYEEVQKGKGQRAKGKGRSETIVVDSYEGILELISSLVGRWDVDEIVIGLPLRSDGSKGEMAEEVERFQEDLVERVGVSVHLIDERMTSLAASRALKEMGVKTGHRKDEVDRIAATLLLQDYLMIHHREYGKHEDTRGTE